MGCNNSARYQAAIIQNHHVLLLKVRYQAFPGRTFWVIPGGGQLPGESEEDCVKREVREETHLEVKIDRLILDESGIPGGIYRRIKTYLCRIISGDPQPGSEPEVDTAEHVTIIQIGWFDLRDPGTWDSLVLNDPITHPLLQRLRRALDYVTGS
ncbi:MAG TPA: NUDIX hydrolase [Anaerolineales bacterium]|nr:NUDIX hydrolase [Anaerolineales bacterium]